MIERDRSAFVEQKAWEAQAAAIQHDSQKTYGIVRTLAGKSSARVEHPVMRKDGELIKDESASGDGRSISRTSLMVTSWIFVAFR